MFKIFGFLKSRKREWEYKVCNIPIWKNKPSSALAKSLTAYSWGEWELVQLDPGSEHGRRAIFKRRKE